MDYREMLDKINDLRRQVEELARQDVAAAASSSVYALLAGRASSQVLNGGVAANEDLTLRGTSHATKTTSYVLLQDTGGNVGIGTTAPDSVLHILGTNAQTGGLTFESSAGSSADRMAIYPIGNASIAFEQLANGDFGYYDSSGNVIATFNPVTGVMSYRQSGVAHGMTAAVVSTDTHTHIGPLSTTAGGTQIIGVSDTDAAAMLLRGIIGSTDPTDSVAAITLRGGKKNTTDAQALAAAETILKIDNNGSTVVTVLGNGNTTFAGALNVQGATDLDTTLNVDGAATFQSVVNLSPGGTQDYQISDDGGSALTIQGRGTGLGATVRIQSFDADGTDANSFQIWGLGKTGASTNVERILMLYNLTQFEIFTSNSGTGTLRPLVIYTLGNTNQVRLLTDGKVVFGMATTGGNGVALEAGTSGNDAAVGGVLYADTTVTGQVGAGPDVLATYTVPGGTLAVNNQSMWWEAAGTWSAGVTVGVLTFEFGATTVLTITDSPVGQPAWWARGRVFRTGAATQRAVSFGTSGETASPAISTGSVTPAETLSGSVVFRIRGNSTSATNNDTVCHSLIVGYDDANS